MLAERVAPAAGPRCRSASICDHVRSPVLHQHVERALSGVAGMAWLLMGCRARRSGRAWRRAPPDTGWVTVAGMPMITAAPQACAFASLSAWHGSGRPQGPARYISLGHRRSVRRPVPVPLAPARPAPRVGTGCWEGAAAAPGLSHELIRPARAPGAPRECQARVRDDGRRGLIDNKIVRWACLLVVCSDAAVRADTARHQAAPEPTESRTEQY
jgi:hypothetical protein